MVDGQQYRNKNCKTEKYKMNKVQSASFKYWQTRTIISTIIIYATFYLVRKNLSMAMPDLQADLGITKAQLGLFLTLHGAIYGISKFLSGFAADRLSSRHMLVVALLLCSLCNILFGLSSSLLVLGIFWVLNGLFQGAGFPPIAHLLTHWIHPKELATKMSWWNTSHSIGAGLAVIISGYLVSFGWRWCFFVPAGIALFGVVFTWFSIRNSPKSVGLPELGSNANENNQNENNINKPTYKELLVKKVFKNKTIWIISIANFFVYVLRFAVLDWGPTMLKEWKGISLAHAGWMVAAFEVAGLIGIVSAGWITDKFFGSRASRVCMICMVIATLSIFLFWQVTTAPVWLYLFFLIAAGFFIYGAQAMGGIASANIATREVAAVSVGFHGFWGYLSVIVTGWGVGHITDLFGWSYSLGFIFGAGVIGSLIFAMAWGAKSDGYEVE